MTDLTLVLVTGARTPVGRLGGVLAGAGAVKLGAATVRVTLEHD